MASEFLVKTSLSLKGIVLRPNFVKELKPFEAEHESPYGKTTSKWKWKKKIITYEVVIPANSTATLGGRTKKTI